MSQIPESAKVKLFAGLDGLAGKSFKDIRNILLNDYRIENISVHKNVIEFQLHKGKADNQQINCIIDKISFKILQDQLLTAKPDSFSSMNLLGLNNRADEYKKALSQLKDCPFIELMTINEAYPHFDPDDEYKVGTHSLLLNPNGQVPDFSIDSFDSEMELKTVTRQEY